jgi:16S rRNA (cytosine967-C5)-methyltransferase
MSSMPGYAAVNETVELAKKVAPKAGGFVNWALRKAGPDTAQLPRRRDIEDLQEWLSTFYSFPRWLVKRWHRRFGLPETERLLASINTYPPLGVRVNRRRAGPEQVSASFQGEGAEVIPGRYSPDALQVGGAPQLTGLASFRRGEFYIQDESAQLASLALAPAGGERVLDACSGLGGKATHLAEIAGDRCEVIAVDRDQPRLEMCHQNASRLGLKSISAIPADILDGDFDPGAPFDRILLDAPCSGLGTLRRHPELKWSKKASDPGRLAQLQLRLLMRVSNWLKAGGCLAYSTCTTEREENEEVVRRFLHERPEFEVSMPERGAIANLDEG